MNVDNEKLRVCVEAAHEMAEYYKGNCLVDHDKKSLDDLMRFCADYLQKPVKIRDLELRTNADTSFRGVMLPHEDGHFEIYVLQDSDEDYRRFVTCKELFQAILNDESAHNINIYEHISGLLFQDTLAPTPAVIYEQMAEIAAMEFLYPYEHRVKDLKAIKEKTSTYAKIAKHYGIPLLYVEKYLLEDFMEALKDSHIMHLVEAAKAKSVG